VERDTARTGPFPGGTSPCAIPPPPPFQPTRAAWRAPSISLRRVRGRPGDHHREEVRLTGATAIAALGRCVQFFRITAASVVGCTRPSAPRSSSGTVLGPRMPARPLAILPAAAEIDARPLGQAAENGQHQATMGRRGVGPASPRDRKASTLVGQLPPCLPLADASPGTRRGRCLGRRYDRRRYRRGNRGGSLLDQTASTCLASAVRKESLAIELIEFATIPLGGAG
jgi:hypothetical protein